MSLLFSYPLSVMMKAIRDPLVVVNARVVDPPEKFSRKFGLASKWIILEAEGDKIRSVDQKPERGGIPPPNASEDLEAPGDALPDDSFVEEGRIEAVMVTLPPPKKQYPSRRMTYILLDRLRTARERIKNLTELEKFQRATERQLLEVNIRRCTPSSQFYLSEVCPLLLELSKLQTQAETFVLVRKINYFVHVFLLK